MAERKYFAPVSERSLIWRRSFGGRGGGFGGGWGRVVVGESGSAGAF